MPQPPAYLRTLPQPRYLFTLPLPVPTGSRGWLWHHTLPTYGPTRFRWLHSDHALLPPARYAASTLHYLRLTSPPLPVSPRLSTRQPPTCYATLLSVRCYAVGSLPLPFTVHIALFVTFWRTPWMLVGLWFGSGLPRSWLAPRFVGFYRLDLRLRLPVATPVENTCYGLDALVVYVGPVTVHGCYCRITFGSTQLRPCHATRTFLLRLIYSAVMPVAQRGTFHSLPVSPCRCGSTLVIVPAPLPPWPAALPLLSCSQRHFEPSPVCRRSTLIRLVCCYSAYDITAIRHFRYGQGA